MTEELTARQQVAEWFRERIKDEPEFRIPDIVNEAVAHFSKRRPFVAQLVQESLRSMVYGLAQDTVRGSRGEIVSIGDTIADRESVRQKTRAAAASRKWQRWMEHVGDRHISLMEMTREDLQVAAAERRQRANSELEVAALWDALARKLEGGQAVKDRFTSDEINAIALDLRNRMRRKKAS